MTVKQLFKISVLLLVLQVIPCNIYAQSQSQLEEAEILFSRSKLAKFSDKKMVKMQQQAADLGYPPAINYIAWRYYEGVNKYVCDYDKALSLFKKVIDSELPSTTINGRTSWAYIETANAKVDAMYGIGLCYWHGHGVTADMKKAMEYFDGYWDLKDSLGRYYTNYEFGMSRRIAWTPQSKRQDAIRSYENIAYKKGIGKRYQKEQEEKQKKEMALLTHWSDKLKKYQEDMEVALKEGTPRYILASTSDSIRIFIRKYENKNKLLSEKLVPIAKQLVPFYQVNQAYNIKRGELFIYKFDSDFGNSIVYSRDPYGVWQRSGGVHGTELLNSRDMIKEALSICKAETRPEYKKYYAACIPELEDRLKGLIEYYEVKMKALREGEDRAANDARAKSEWVKQNVGVSDILNSVKEESAWKNVHSTFKVKDVVFKECDGNGYFSMSIYDHGGYFKYNSGLDKYNSYQDALISAYYSHYGLYWHDNKFY